MVRSIGKNLLHFNIQNLIWCLKYYFGTINNSWYFSLFEYGKNKISGDITPAYHLLGLNEVKQIYNILPDTKILFIIRNPIDRTWSQLRKNGQTKWSNQDLQKKIESDDIKLRNNYLYAIKNWQRYYPANQFKLLFFDDIIRDPDSFLKNILSFLSLNKTVLQSIPIRSKINSAPSENINPIIKKLIVKSALPDLKELCNEIGGYSINWFEEAESFLKSDK